MELLVLFVGLLVFSLLPFSSSITPNSSFLFLSCGASSSTTLSHDAPPRSFVPDSTYLSSSHRTLSLSNPSSSSSSPSPLYSTARVSTSPFSYNLPVSIPGSYVLRLHFLPFPSPPTTSPSPSSTSPPSTASPSSPPSPPSNLTIAEFLLPAAPPSLALSFSPSPLLPRLRLRRRALPRSPELLSDPLPTPVGAAPLLRPLSGQALRTLYRVNVGGPEVTPANDTLWRTWVPDEPFLFDPDLSLVNSTPAGNVVYDAARGRTREIAPPSVYDTARTVAVSPLLLISNPDFNANLTWTFPVDPGYSYLVRAHFCDLISPTLSTSANSGLKFNVYVMGLSAYPNLNPSDFTNQLAEAFYVDFVVNNSGGRNNGHRFRTAVILASVLTVAAVAIILGAAIFVCRRYRLTSAAKSETTPISSWSPYTPGRVNSVSLSSKSTAGRLNLGLLISFAEIKSATGGFDERNVIGVGGFGKVYKGVLNDGTRVAVKRGCPDPDKDSRNSRPRLWSCPASGTGIWSRSSDTATSNPR
uniref:Protein kinase domain-containing protein n=1 Tax=Ananas comosus var. bracteatus TaxID=296719 RepID=A0A6V7PXA6_ANACO|nr:unnamed protein product [Ananas comosus var. bracteatus]